MKITKTYRIESGRYKGQTVRLGMGGIFPFVKGEMVVTGTREEHALVAKSVAQWGGKEVVTDGVRNPQEGREDGGHDGNVGHEGEGTETSDQASDVQFSDKPPGSDEAGRLDSDGDGSSEGMSPFLQKLSKALDSLDPSVDTHWTAAGKPSLQALEAAMGEAGVTRAMVDKLTHGATRPKK